MHKIRKQKIKFIYKKAYEDKVIVMNGNYYDLSLIWSIIEDISPDIINIKELLEIINEDVVKLDYSENIDLDYPVLIHNEKIVDGEYILMNSFLEEDSKVSVIFLDEIDLSEAIIE